MAGAHQQGYQQGWFLSAAECLVLQAYGLDERTVEVAAAAVAAAAAAAAGLCQYGTVHHGYLLACPPAPPPE